MESWLNDMFLDYVCHQKSLRYQLHCVRPRVRRKISTKSQRPFNQPRCALSSLSQVGSKLRQRNIKSTGSYRN